MPRVSTTKSYSALDFDPLTIKCPWCPSQFSHPADLKRHVDIHDAKTKLRFRCTYEDCPFSSRQKCNLNVHIKTVHLKIKDIHCEHCSEFVTGSMSSLNHHLKRKHAGLKHTHPKLRQPELSYSPQSSSSSESGSESESPSSSSSSPPSPTEFKLESDLDSNTYFSTQYDPTASTAKSMFPAVHDLYDFSFNPSDFQWDSYATPAADSTAYSPYYVPYSAPSPSFYFAPLDLYGTEDASTWEGDSSLFF